MIHLIKEVMDQKTNKMTSLIEYELLILANVEIISK